MTLATERMAKYKAKLQPDVLYLRTKQVHQLAVEKYANRVENFVRLENFLAGLGLKLPYEGRMFQFARELQHLIVTDPERAKKLWEAYGLDPEPFEVVARLMQIPARQVIISECRISL